MINDICQIITRPYVYGPKVDEIRAAWSALDFKRIWYITRNKLSDREG